MIEAADRIAPSATLIGPGRLVLVVGPSGAGKDTILSRVREACADDLSIVFPRRVVTRPHGDNEDHDSLDEERFAAASRDGAFALSWQAHGLSYGIPAAVDDDLRVGRVVVCNVSRGIVAQARARYARVLSVLITAAPDLLRKRLAARGRASDASLAERLDRNMRYSEFSADAVIRNDGAVEDTIMSFLVLLQTIRAE